MALPSNTIEKIKVGTTDHSLIASHITTGGTTPEYKTWTDITSLVNTAKVKFLVCNAANNTPKGVTFTPKGGSTAITGTLEAASADLTTFYLVYDNNATDDAYDEYVSTGTAWEKIGDTGIDLSGYAHTGTYTTSTPSTNTTGEGGSQTATGTATISYDKATQANSAGGFTINGTNFSFTGTAATITVEGDFTPAGSISGSQNVNAHSHTVNAVTDSITYVTGVKSTGGTANALTGVTASGTTTVLTGVKASGTTNAVTGYSAFNGGDASLSTKNYGFASTTSDVMYSPTVTSGVLSWSIKSAGTQDAISFTPASLGTASTASVVTGVAADGTASVVTGVTSNGTASVILSTGLTTSAATFVTGATLGTAGAVTISGSNFTFSGTSASFSLSTDYTPAGTIGGSQTVSGHTHGISTTPTSVTGTAAVAVSNHTHTMGNHTHSVTIS